MIGNMKNFVAQRDALKNKAKILNVFHDTAIQFYQGAADDPAEVEEQVEPPVSTRLLIQTLSLKVTLRSYINFTKTKASQRYI